MTPENFCYWLQGLFELTDSDTLSTQQIQIIKNHLQLVFTKVTPDIELEDVELDEADDLGSRLKKMMEDFEKQDVKVAPVDSDHWVYPNNPYPVFPDEQSAGDDPDAYRPVITCKVKSDHFC